MHKMTTAVREEHRLREEYLAPFRLPDGTFPHWIHTKRFGIEMGTIFGEQFIPPWHSHPRYFGYVTDDFGNATVILDEAERRRLRA